MLQPFEIVEPYLASGQLLTLLPEYSAPTRPMHILYAPDRRMTPKLRSFIEFGVEQAVVSPAAISITAGRAGCSYRDRTDHTG